MQTFSLSRLLHLLKKEIIENSRIVFITIFITFLIMFLLVMAQFLLSSDSEIETLIHTIKVYYFIGLYILAAAFAGYSFPAFRKKEKAMNYLLLPVSNMEKFLSYFTLSTIGFFVVYTILFYLFYLLLFFFISFNLSGDLIMFPFSFRYILNYFIAFININALFLLGATIFKRTPPFLTIVVFSLAQIVLFIIIALFMNIYDINNLFTHSEQGNYIAKSGDHIGVRIDDNGIYKVLKFLTYYGVAIFFWFIAYLKIKEKEV